MMDYERRQVYRGPEAYVDLPADAEELDTRIAEALAEHPDNDELRAAVVTRGIAPRAWWRCCSDGEAITDHRRWPEARCTSGLAEKAQPPRADPAAAR